MMKYLPRYYHGHTLIGMMPTMKIKLGSVPAYELHKFLTMTHIFCTQTSLIGPRDVDVCVSSHFIALFDFVTLQFVIAASW